MVETPPGNGFGNGNGNGRALKWHRVLGLGSAVVVIFLSITGIVLNHGTTLDLDRRTTDSQWLLNWYGLAHEGDIVSFAAGDHWVSWSDDHLFLDGRAVAEHTAPVVGATQFDGMIAAATGDEVFLLTVDGNLIERLTDAALPGAVSRAGRDSQSRMIIEAGGGTYVAKNDFAGWAPVDDGSQVEWQNPSPTPADIRRKVLVDYRGTGLPWSRVLLDVHSGRIFGAWGPYVMDAAAVILLILAVTGFVNWRRRK